VALLFYSGTDRNGTFEASFRSALKKVAPSLEVRTWPELGDANDIRFAALWLPPENLFSKLPNLTHIFALSAGVDKLLQASDLPQDVPIYRLLDGGMATPMSEYVLLGVLQAQRQLQVLAEAQQQKLWKRDTDEPQAKDWHVGILGAGVLAQAAAQRLVANGYPVSTWSRSHKNTALNTLVCLLPLTPNTANILNSRLFDQLPTGASLINAARGEHCVDDDLIAALDRGQISSALLDVFREEPLPAEHLFWSHPKITITPHIAAPTSADVSARYVAEGVANALAGTQPAGLVNRHSGY